MSNDLTQCLYNVAVKALSELSIDERIDAIYEANEISHQVRANITDEFMTGWLHEREADGSNVVKFPKGGAS